MKPDVYELDPSLAGLFVSDMPRLRASKLFEPDIPSYLFVRSKKAPPQMLPDVNARRREREQRLDEGLPQVGSILDKYRLEEVLGKGGFAVVYRATHLLLRSRVALKLLRPKIVQKDPSFAELLCEEARLAARIDHPNVVRVQDVTHTREITYIIMEFIDGPNLGRRIDRGGPLGTVEALSVAMDVTQGLAAGYEQGIIHRDIKPANVLLAKSGVAKIVDLGLAHPLDVGPVSTATGSSPVPISSRLTVIGTPAYMAPEQTVSPNSVDFRADIYSLGVSLFQMVTGKLPYSTREPAECVEMHRSAPIPRANTVSPSVPAELSELIYEMMAKSAQDRPFSYASLLSRLSTIRARLTQSESALAVTHKGA